METLESFKRKIETTDDLRSVVRTMKTMAAVNVRQFGRAVESLKAYSGTVQDGMQIALRDRELDAKQLPAPDTAGGTGIIAFGSEQGLCGQFNEKIAALTERHSTALPSAGKRCPLFIVGARLAAQLEARGITFERLFPMPVAVEGIDLTVQELVIAIDEWDLSRHIAKVVLLSNVPQGGTSYVQQESVLLPVSLEWLKMLKARPWKTRVLPVHTMDFTALFSALLRQHLYISLFSTIASSIAAENVGRLAAMQAAEKNIDDRLRELRLAFNQLRQDSITAELLDIVAGYEAMKNEGR
jgi:F-type H+-transporting ATPase subunit gamma